MIRGPSTEDVGAHLDLIDSFISPWNRETKALYSVGAEVCPIAPQIYFNRSYGEFPIVSGRGRPIN
jgi:hypothetical protein